MRSTTYIGKPKEEIRLMTKTPNIDRIDKYQTLQMVSIYQHSTLHDITEAVPYQNPVHMPASSSCHIDDIHNFFH